MDVAHDRPQKTPVTPPSTRDRKNSESSSQDKSPGDTPFDSSKKPKKSILKKKYVGADSGCVLDDINISEYFTSDKNDKLRRTKGHGAKHASSGASRSRGASTPESVDSACGVSEVEERMGSVDLGKVHSSDNSKVKTTAYMSDETNKSPSKSGSKIPKPGKSGSGHSLSKYPESPKDSSSHNNTNKDRQTTSDSITSRSPATSGSKTSKNPSTPVSRKIKGILKRNGKFSSSSSSSDRDPSWRHSLGSQSSNSSGDLLDFSYDSTDTDSLLSSSNVLRPHWRNAAFSQIGPEDEGYTDVAELSIYHGDSGRTDTLYNQHNSDDIMNKINMLDETYYEEGIHRGAVSADLFNPNEAQAVYKQALEICNKIK